jgi:glycosyltransferase involved in cell wall biosynthesis
MNIVLFTNIPSPFMLDFAESMNSFEDINFHICFCEDTLQDRGKHWKDNRSISKQVYYYIKSEDFDKWLLSILEKVHPDIVICSYNIGKTFDLIALNKAKYKYKLGKWNEQPPLYESNLLKRKLRQVYLKRYWRNKVDFLLAIGHHSVNDFRKYLDDPQKIFLFPYQLKIDYATEPKVISEPVIFLFSGRLIKRNNIRNMTGAFYKLSLNYPGRFKWIISASGPEDSIIKKYMKDIRFADHVEYDIQFTNWDDRLRPFKKSHVLVVPAFNSGWGLVVPEALALGLPVITTDRVGSADYLIEHMINGIFVKTDSKSIYKALQYCLLNKNEITRMSKNALSVRNSYNINKGANQLHDILVNSCNVSSVG